MKETDGVQRLSANGRCFLEYSCRLPRLPEGKAGARIEKTLRALSDAARASAEAALPSLAEQYESGTDPCKAFRHRPLCLSLRFSASEEKNALLITAALTLSRSGRTLKEKESAFRFDKQSGYALPRQGQKKRKEKSSARREQLNIEIHEGSPSL